jgi:glycosyltransferase involved in cell wall biosynthesis
VRVLELLSSPFWTGPAEPMSSVARELLRRGHEVELAVDGRRPGDLRDRLRDMGFRVRDGFTLSTRSGPLRMLGDLRALRRASREVDVLHANFSHDHALALLAGAGEGRHRVVRTVHSSRSLSRRPLQRLAHRRTDGLVAVCPAHAQILVEAFGVPPERVLVTRGAVDAARFSPEGPDLRAELGLAPGQPVVGIVSRVKPDRRHGELVDAFRRVVDRLPEARLVVVGRGEGIEAVKARVAARDLERQVIFAGYRAGAELPAAYRTLDVKALLAEGNDGTCRALLEGMACGRPGVAFRFGAPADAIVDGVSGLLVPDGDLPALADALLALLAAPVRARELGRAARARMTSLFTEEARGEAVERFLREILSLPPARARG